MTTSQSHLTNNKNAVHEYPTTNNYFSGTDEIISVVKYDTETIVSECSIDESSTNDQNPFDTPTVAQPPEVVFSSYLWKRGRLVKKWRRRWYVFTDDGILHHFDTKEQWMMYLRYPGKIIRSKKKQITAGVKAPLKQGSIDIKDVISIERNPEGNSKRQFQWTLSTDSRTWNFCCERKKEYVQWLRTLRLFHAQFAREPEFQDGEGAFDRDYALKSAPDHQSHNMRTSLSSECVILENDHMSCTSPSYEPSVISLPPSNTLFMTIAHLYAQIDG